MTLHAPGRVAHGRCRAALAAMMKRMATNKVVNVQQLDEELMPYWLQVPRCQEIREECAMLGDSKTQDCTRVLRKHNAKLQPHTYSWNVMLQMLEATLDEDRKKVQKAFFEHLEAKQGSRRHDAKLDADSEDILYKCGPVGDLPLHQAFLLGLDDLGKELIKRYYTRDEHDGNYFLDKQGQTTFFPRPDAGINTPYVSDLDFWKPLVGNLFDDGGLYSGETVLHIAIVQQKTRLVQWMLDRHACITARARGAFFKPSLCYTEQDLQAVNMSSLGSSHSIHAFANQDSVCDYGEFPFSFAACVGNVEILALLAKHAERGGIAKEELIEVLKTQRKIRASLGIEQEIVVTEKGGFMRLLVGLQDSRGNTALHMAVRYNKKVSIDWIMAHYGQESLHMLNADGMTPFTLAARLGNVEVFHHILRKHMTQVVYTFGSTQVSHVSLAQLDTYRTSSALHRHPKWQSALEIIINVEKDEFSKDELVRELLLEKWVKFAKQDYLRQFLLPYFLFLGNYFSTLILRTEQLDTAMAVSFVDDAVASILMGRSGGAADLTQVTVNWRSFVSLVLHGILIVVWLPWLLYIGYRSMTKWTGAEPLARWVFKNLTLILGCMTCIIIVLSAVARALDQHVMERNVWALGSIWCCLQVLVLIIPFRFFGFIVIAIWRMMLDDITVFILIYSLLHLAFSQALSLTFVKTPVGIMPPDYAYATTVPGMLMYEFWTGLDNLGLGELLEYSRHLAATQLFHLSFIMLFNVLGLNLIIAMMGRTFATETEDVYRTWIFPFATMVLRLEQNLTEAQKINCEKYRCGKPSSDSRLQVSGSETLDALDEGEHEEVPPAHASSSWWPWGNGNKVAVSKHELSDWEREFYLHTHTVLSDSEAEADNSSLHATDTEGARGSTGNDRGVGGKGVLAKAAPVAGERGASGDRLAQHQDEVMSKLKDLQNSVVSHCEHTLRALLAQERKQLETERKGLQRERQVACDQRDAAQTKELATRTAVASPAGDSGSGGAHGNAPLVHSKPAPYASPLLAGGNAGPPAHPAGDGAYGHVDAGWPQAQRQRPAVQVAYTLPNAHNQTEYHHQAYQGQGAACRQPQTFAQQNPPPQTERPHQPQMLQQQMPHMPQMQPPAQALHMHMQQPMRQPQQDHLQASRKPPAPPQHAHQRQQQEQQMLLPNVPFEEQNEGQQRVRLEQQQRSRQEYEQDMQLLSLEGLGVLGDVDTQQPKQGSAGQAQHVSAASPGSIKLALAPNSSHASGQDTLEGKHASTAAPSQAPQDTSRGDISASSASAAPVPRQAVQPASLPYNARVSPRRQLIDPQALTDAPSTKSLPANDPNALEQARERVAQERMAELEQKLEVASVKERAREAEEKVAILEEQIQRLQSDKAQRVAEAPQAPVRPVAISSAAISSAHARGPVERSAAVASADDSHSEPAASEGSSTRTAADALPNARMPRGSAQAQAWQAPPKHAPPAHGQAPSAQAEPASESVTSAPRSTSAPRVPSATPPAPAVAVQLAASLPANEAGVVAEGEAREARQSEAPLLPTSNKPKRRPLRPLSVKPHPTEPSPEAAAAAAQTVGVVNARAAPTDTDTVIAQESSSPTKKRATREGMKKIWVQEVVEGTVLDREEWVPDPRSPPKELFASASNLVADMVHGPAHTVAK